MLLTLVPLQPGTPITQQYSLAFTVINDGCGTDSAVVIFQH